MKITKEEAKALQTEIAERLRDVVYGRADYQAKKVVEQIGRYPDNMDSATPVEINFTVNMCVGDLMQIVSRVRRKRRA